MDLWEILSIVEKVDFLVKLISYWFKELLVCFEIIIILGVKIFNFKLFDDLLWVEEISIDVERVRLVGFCFFCWIVKLTFLV